MKRITPEERDPLPWRCWLIALAVALGLVGYYGPWVAHRAAGLVVIGLDLGEFVKFLPEVASRQVPVQRELFYLPLFAGSVTASLLASRNCFPLWQRCLLAFVAVPLALAMLPPAWSPAILGVREFRLQVLAIAVCLALIPGIVLTRYLPNRLILAVIAAFALLAAIGPTWAFLQISGAVNTAYRRPPALGWGFWLCFFGFFGAAFLAMAEVLRDSSDAHSKR
jgi:hypothetical protein